MKQTKLSLFRTEGFDKGASGIKQIAWYFVNALIVNTSWMPITSVKVALIRAFGARIGRGIVLKNRVNIKFPWKLTVGDNVWLGERVWIDNLDFVAIGNDVCISQGAMLLTGNHDYTIPEFYYRNAPITLEDGVWIGAQAVVCPGVRAHSHSILAVGSVATKPLEAYGIYQGNPSVKIRERIFK
ncbi:MAG: WcaF family extracellular polysaccharide biosynthesis acetyltransferase [Rikenellaceae bacterium]